MRIVLICYFNVCPYYRSIFLFQDLNNYAKITRGEWRSEKSKRAQKLKREEETKKLFYGENAQKETSFPDSGMMLFFWKNRESEFPFLSKVAIYVRDLNLIFIKKIKVVENSLQFQRSGARIRSNFS